jgi:hypothetical protein
MDFKNILNKFDQLKSDAPALQRVKKEPRQVLKESTQSKTVDVGAVKVPSLANIFRELMENDQNISIEPTKPGAQVLKKDNQPLGVVHSPQVASQLKTAIDKGELTFGEQEIKEAEEWIKGAIKDPGAFSAKAKSHGMSTKEFVNYVLSHKDKFPSKTEKQATLAKTLGKMKEGERPLQGPGQASPLTFESKHKDSKRDDKAEKAGKKVTKDLEYDMNHKGKDDKKAEKAGKEVTKDIEYDEWKKSHLPSMSRIKKMCKDGMTQSQILKLHPKCDKEDLKDLIKKCKKTLNEGADHILKAARHMGKAHGLNKHSYANPHDQGTNEARSYHEGYVEGLDECMGIRNEPIIGMTEEDPSEVVDSMASYGAMGEAENSPDGNVGADDDGTFDKYNWGAEKTDEDKAYMDDDVEEGNAFTGKLASTPKGGEFDLDGKKYKDTSSLEEEAWTFENLQKELDNLLNEGVNISVSTGNEHGPDTVSVSATDSEADKLLQFVKSVGLGVYGDDDAKVVDVVEPGEVSFYGAPDAIDEPNGSHDDMLKLLGMMDDPEMVHDNGDDYEEEGPEDSEDHAHEAKMCNECGMTESKCGCNKMEEDAQNPPDSGAQNSENDEKGNADANASLADQESGTPQLVKEKDDMDKLKEMMKMLSEVGDEASEQPEQPLGEDQFNTVEDFFRKVARTGDDMLLISAMNGKYGDKIEKAASDMYDEISRDSGYHPDDDFEKIYDKMMHQIEQNVGKGKEKDELDETESEEQMEFKVAESDEEVEGDPDATEEMLEEKLDEWANDAGKKGTDTSFQQDIDFMTKVISGGLNKQKSTGQTTVPVIAGQKDRMGKDGINEGKSFKDILSVFDSLTK